MRTTPSEDNVENAYDKLIELFHPSDKRIVQEIIKNLDIPELKNLKEKITKSEQELMKMFSYIVIINLRKIELERNKATGANSTVNNTNNKTKEVLNNQRSLNEVIQTIYPELNEDEVIKKTNKMITTIDSIIEGLSNKTDKKIIFYLNKIKEGQISDSGVINNKNTEIIKTVLMNTLKKGVSIRDLNIMINFMYPQNSSTLTDFVTF